MTTYRDFYNDRVRYRDYDFYNDVRPLPKRRPEAPSVRLDARQELLGRLTAEERELAEHDLLPHIIVRGSEGHKFRISLTGINHNLTSLSLLIRIGPRRDLLPYRRDMLRYGSKFCAVPANQTGLSYVDGNFWWVVWLQQYLGLKYDEQSVLKVALP